VPNVSGEIGQYRITSKLGKGGMGEVYKALHVRLKREVAIKFLLPTATGAQGGLQRFLHEVEALGQLDHPNIVRATDAGEWEGRHYLVTEYLDGLNLHALVKAAGPLAVADACELVRQAAAGLQYVHEKGQVHRDIKPSNLFCTRAGVVKILDLGLVRLKGTCQEGAITRTGEVMGTFDYMPPEQASDSHDVDIRADLYSLGCTLYFLLTGKPPFPAVSAPAKLVAHAHQPPPAIADSRPDVPAPVVAVIERLLAKQPEERFPTPAALIAALEPWTVGADLRQLLAALPPPEPSDVAPVGQAESVREPSTRPHTMSTATAPPRRPWLGTALAAAALLLAGALVLVAWNLRETKPPTAEPPSPTVPAPPKPTGAPEPGKWQSLLSQAPVLLEKPKQHNFDTEKKEFWWDTQGECLVQLGETAARDFDLEVVFHRSAPPASPMGLFWGYQKDPARTAKEAYCYQAIDVRTLLASPNGDSQLVWKIRRVQKTPNASSAEPLGAQDLPPLPFPTFTLALQVRNNRLDRVKLNGQDVLVVDAKRKIDASSKGAFGVCANSGAGTVLEARVFIHAKEK
jgi:serine/threonine protein kinase